MRILIKQLIAAVLVHSGLLAALDLLARRFGAGKFGTVLMYHRVLKDPFDESHGTEAGISISTSSFEKHIAYLAGNYTVMSARDYIQRLRRNEPLPKKSVVITFDDGWLDNYTYAYPILKEYKVPATIFVCTDLAGTDRKFWFHEIGHAILTKKLSPAQLNQALSTVAANSPQETDRRYTISDTLSGSSLLGAFLTLVKSLKAEQIDLLVRELQAANGVAVVDSREIRSLMNWEEIISMAPELIEIGSHGKSHLLLTAISKEDVADELAESKQEIEAKTGRTVVSFAYPNGSYDDTICRLVGEAGYQGAFVAGYAQKDPVNLFTLPRIGFHEGTTAAGGGKFSRALFKIMLSPAIRALKRRIQRMRTAG